jgi:nicotinamide mononucleotide (NMN) deamidase PncC
MPTYHEMLELASRCERSNARALASSQLLRSGHARDRLSEVPGAAERLHGGFVTYTKEDKTAALASRARSSGEAVCGEIADATAEGALRRSLAQVAVPINAARGDLGRDEVRACAVADALHDLQAIAQRD